MFRQPTRASGPQGRGLTRQLLDRTSLRWSEALQLGAALAAREMFQGTEIVFVSASPRLLAAATAEGFKAMDPAKEPEKIAKE